MSISEVANCDDKFSRTKLDFEQYNKRRVKCFSEVKRKLLWYSICVNDEKNLKLKGRIP